MRTQQPYSLIEFPWPPWTLTAYLQLTQAQATAWAECLLKPRMPADEEYAAAANCAALVIRLLDPAVPARGRQAGTGRLILVMWRWG